jgi:hypothetical protein
VQKPRQGLEKEENMQTELILQVLLLLSALIGICSNIRYIACTSLVVRSLSGILILPTRLSNPSMNLANQFFWVGAVDTHILFRWYTRTESPKPLTPAWILFVIVDLTFRKVQLFSVSPRVQGPVQQGDSHLHTAFISQWEGSHWRCDGWHLNAIRNSFFHASAFP